MDKKTTIKLLITSFILIGIVSAGLLDYYNIITNNAEVDQILLIDNKQMKNSEDITEIWNGIEFTPFEEKFFISHHILKNQGSVSVEVELNKKCSPKNNCNGISTVYYSPTIENLKRGANRLVETQNNDGGWDWGEPNDNYNDTSPVNTIGVTAQGLLDVYTLTNNESYLDSAINAAEYIENVTDSERIRGPDITFLVELSEITKKSEYASLAKEEYKEALKDYGNENARDFAEYIRDLRKNDPALISWDINFYVQSALALDRYYSGKGYDQNAKNMTEVIYDSFYENPSEFDLSNEEQGYYWLAHTGAIEAFTTTGLHYPERDSLKSNLLNNQKSSGCFVESSTKECDAQTTAYAISALIAINEKEAVLDAFNYLINNQMESGSWGEGSDEYTEVTSEVLQTKLFTEIEEETAFEIKSEEIKNIFIANYFPRMLKPDKYTIKTTIDLVEKNG